MELQIPQSFKVQWLNTTLKFIKDDSQLVKDYPQMPSSHVEYLHNLIWQRKNDVGLGFKSLYSPVWEAMKIHSLKYQFKIVVKKSEDGRSGHLIMEKILKTDQPAKELKDEKNKRDNKIVHNYEVTKKSESEAVKCKQTEPQPFTKEKIKTSIPQSSEGLKIFMDIQKMLDSLSPLFIKTTLTSVLDFISDEFSASKIFSNLAPIESKFLKNFLSIYQRRDDLEVLLSPACNELLAEISNCFDDFNKTFRLDISSLGVNSKTNKREVKYTKVPVFPVKKTKQKLKENSIQTKTTTRFLNDATKLININDGYNNTVPSPEKSTNFTKEGTPSTVDTSYKKVEQMSPRMKILQDMTVPLNSDKAISVHLPEKNNSYTEEGTSSSADTLYIRAEQMSSKIENLQDTTVPSSCDKALSHNYEIAKKSESEAVNCKQAEPQPLNKEKIKASIPQLSQGLKIFMENQKILDSLSPLFIKTTLASVLDFISDEFSAIKIFSNLAPIESRFLENFLSIYQRRDNLEVLLSPACNELLAEISNCFNDFNKTFRLDISSLAVNSNTNKREVKFTKVPVSPRKKKAKQKLKENSIQTQTTTISPSTTTKLENMPSTSKKEYNNTVEKNVSKETIKSKSQNQTKVLQNNAITESRYAISQPIDKVIETTDNKVIEALSTFIKKPDDVKPKTNLNKSVLLPKKSTSFTKEGTSSTVDTSYKKVEQMSPRMKILQDMTVPLNSDKAIRMMQLMGWEGGALGVRGDGITEPIIPIFNIKTRGLGHVPVKNDSNKETKRRSRSEFVNKILKMIDNDIEMSVITLKNKLIEREIQFWQLTLQLINRRSNLDAELENRIEIKDKMIRNMDIMFNIDFEDDNRKIIITKTTKTKTKAVYRDAKKDTKSEEIDYKSVPNSNSKARFKTIVLKAILELLKSKDEEKVIQFNKELEAKRLNYSNTLIQLINERHYVKQKNNKVVGELGSKVLNAIGDILLSVKIYENERYIVIQKRYPRSNLNQEIIKTVVKKAESDDKKGSFDNVRSHLPTKKKHKLLNALYRYEMEYTEEFEENQWYNTVDKSLLDSEKMFNINNNTKMIYNDINKIKKICTQNNNLERIQEINKNNKRKIEYDQNNNGALSVTFKV